MTSTQLARGTATLGLLLALAACGAQPAPREAASATQAAPAAASLPAVDMAKAKAASPGATQVEALQFDMKGSRTVQGRIAGDRAPAYAIPVAAGQTLHVVFKSTINAATFNVVDAANPAEAVHRGSVDGNTATVKAAQATTYVVVPFQERAVARRGTVAPYTLTVRRD